MPRTKSFPIIKYEYCCKGMLVRPSTSNIHMYQFVEETVITSKGEKKIICNQEGNSVTFNTGRNKAYRFALLSTTIPKSDFEAIDWPGRK